PPTPPTPPTPPKPPKPPKPPAPPSRPERAAHIDADLPEIAAALSAAMDSIEVPREGEPEGFVRTGGGAPTAALKAPAPSVEPWALDFPAQKNPQPERYILKPMPKGDEDAPVGVYGERSLAEILFSAFQNIFSGRLILERGEQRKVIIFAQGRPVGSRSNIPSEALGHLLFKEGRITEAQHRQSVKVMRAEGLRQGEALIKIKALHPDDLPLYLRKQTQERLLNCFAWSHASYALSYEVDATDRRGAHEVNPLLIIFEGIQRFTPEGLLLHHFNGYNRRPARVTQRIDDYSTLLKPFEQELRLAALCDGTRTLGEVLSESGYGMSESLRILRALEILECVAFDPPKKPAALFSAARRIGARGRGVEVPAPPPEPETLNQLHERLSEGSIYTFLDLEPSLPEPQLREGVARLRRALEAEIKRDEALFLEAEPVFKRLKFAEEVLLNAAKRADYHRVQGLAPLEPARREAPTPRAPHAQIEAPRSTPRRLPAHPPGGAGGVKPPLHPSAQRGSGAYPIPRQPSGAYPIPRQPSGAYPIPRQPSGAYPQQRGATGGYPAQGAAHTGGYPARSFSGQYPSMSPAQMIQLAEQKYHEGRYLLVEDPPRALVCFEAACSLDAHTPLYRMFRGWVRFTLTQPHDRQGKTNAHDEIKQALMDDSQQGIGYVLLGHIYRQTGNVEMAVRLYRRANKLDPQLEEAIEALRDFGA
ncbi:hypothetical protein KJ940_10625, partial [Myxococcota bacterium]|nr:hypothetical protein [Myxococcota bacterium]